MTIANTSANLGSDFCEHPTATLERMGHSSHPPNSGGPERRGGAVGAPIFNGFRKLVPES